MTTIAHFLETLDPGRPTTGARPPVPAQAVVVVTAGSPAAARTAALALANAWADAHPQGTALAAPPTMSWPFVPDLGELPDGDAPVLVWAEYLHAAFANAQGAGARLVTTQAAYLLEVWRDALARRPGSLLVATADAAALEAATPEAATGQGVWRHVAFRPVESEAGEWPPAQAPDGASNVAARLAAAFAQPDPGARLAACVAALDAERTPSTLVAMGSACLEVNDLAAARRVLDDAVAAAPAWAAAHYESGKQWLRAEDMEAAARAFAAAAERLPGFAPAWANLGGTLGELDRPQEALQAFQHAIAADPSSHQALNNIGVVNRELGHLAESEASFRQVITLVPHLAMGHYNLGHTLFLQGRYQAALASYLEGQTRDPERNPVQASRVALARLASGDAAGALRDLQQCMSALPREYRRQLLADTNAVVWALLTHRPDLPGWKSVADWIGGELSRT